MLRLLRLFLWLRWRLAAGGLRAARARGSLSAFAAVLAIALPIGLGTLLALAMAGTALGGHLAGRLLVTSEGEIRAATTHGLRLVGAVLSGVLVGMPWLRAAQVGRGGERGELTRLLLLPVPVRLLHLWSTLRQLFDPWTLLALVGALGVASGILAAGTGPAAALACLLGAGLFALCLAALGAAAALLAEAVLRDRRRGERLALGMTLALLAASLAPLRLEPRATARNAAPATGPRASPGLRPPGPVRFPPIAQLVPSEAWARVAAEAAGGRLGAALGSLLALGTTLVLLYAGGWRLWLWLVFTPARSPPRQRLDVAGMRAARFPFASSAVAALARAHARALLRTVRGKLALLLTPLAAAIAGVLLDDLLSGSQAATALLGLAGTGFALLSLVPLACNQFAADRSGLSLLFLQPLDERTLLRGKALGGALLAVPCLALCWLVVSALAAETSLMSSLAALAGSAAAYTLSVPLAAWLSILFPKDADLSSIGPRGNPHPLAQFLGTIGVVAALLLSSGVLMAGFAAAGPAGAAWASAAWALVSTLLGWAGLEAATPALRQRREVLALVAAGR